MRHDATKHMKAEIAVECSEMSSARTTLGNLCARCCRSVLARIQKAKDALFAEYRLKLRAHDRMVQLALNEAEALAWETTYPHLVFPTLAMEKVQAVAEWSQHQRLVRRADPLSALAA